MNVYLSALVSFFLGAIVGLWVTVAIFRAVFRLARDRAVASVAPPVPGAPPEEEG